MKLYYKKTSAPSRAVLLLVREMSLEVELVVTNPMAGDTLTSEFTKLNPQQKIPVLVNEDMVMSESRAINQYLSTVFGREDLYPNDAKTRFLVDHRLHFEMGTLSVSLANALYETALFHQPPDLEKINQLGVALTWVDEFLEKGGYIAGDSLTIADFSYMAALSTIAHCGINLSPYPNVENYMSKLQGELAGNEENEEGAEAFGEMYKSALKEIEERDE